MKTLVVARYREDVSWITRVPKDWTVRVYDKGAGALPNRGREDYAYLFHIITNYDEIDGDVAFVQGNPFDHCPKVLEYLTDDRIRTYGYCEDCDQSGMPRIAGLCLDGHSAELELPIPARYKFIAGAQFRVSPEQIHAHPLSFYRELFRRSGTIPNMPWALERLWPTIFKLDL